MPSKLHFPLRLSFSFAPHLCPYFASLFGFSRAQTRHQDWPADKDLNKGPGGGAWLGFRGMRAHGPAEAELGPDPRRGLGVHT